MIKIFDYFDPSRIVFLHAATRNDALRELIDRLYEAGQIEDKQEFYDAIMDREKIVSTGIGMGIAIPHAKLADYDDFFISVGILHQGVNWNALDHAPVRLIFMIGGPDDKQTEYLQLLSSLTLALKDEERRKKILALTVPQAILELFSGC